MRVDFLVKNWYLLLQCTNYSKKIEGYYIWHHKHISWSVPDPIINNLKTSQNSLCGLLFRLQIDICFYNAPINLKLSRITLYDITKVFVTQLRTFKICSKCYLRVAFRVKNLYLLLQCTDFPQTFQEYSIWHHKNYSWRVRDTITKILKNVQYILS